MINSQYNNGYPQQGSSQYPPQYQQVETQYNQQQYQGNQGSTYVSGGAPHFSNVNNGMSSNRMNNHSGSDRSSPSRSKSHKKNKSNDALKPH